MSDLITIEKTNGIADVRLNRPEKYNALSPEMFRRLLMRERRWPRRKTSG